MTDNLLIKLPFDIVNNIKFYTGEVKVRNGVPMRQLKKNDIRYSILKKRPRIKQLTCATDTAPYDTRGSAWFKTSDRTKHVVISVYFDIILRVYLWEIAVLGKYVVRQFV
jgi:hypothetical protein